MGTGFAGLESEFWLEVPQAAWATTRAGVYNDAFHPGWYAYGKELNHRPANFTISNKE